MTDGSDFDVVVIGYGYAGGVAAIAAHDAGASVVVLEKLPEPGGISIVSGGGIRVAGSSQQAFTYLKESNAGTTPDDVLLGLAEGMTTIGEFVTRLADRVAARCVYRRAPGNYPFQGGETFGYLSVESAGDFDQDRGYPNARALSPAGPFLFHVIEENLRLRGVEVWTESAGQRLLTDGEGGIRGVRGLHQGQQFEVRARLGVVLACGGFEADYAMQSQYWRGGAVISAAFRGNTGDGLRMAQEVGSDLWHMWHYHGSYGFKDPSAGFPFGIRVRRLPDWVPGREQGRAVPMPWILLDQSGRRFMNEYPPYLHDTSARDLDAYDPTALRHPRLPAWLLVDRRGLELYPLGKPTYHDMTANFDWSPDNQREVAIGLIREVGSLEQASDLMGSSPSGLVESVTRWNRNCELGEDRDHSRPGSTMLPIEDAPFYLAEVWPIVSNTQGGPRHDVKQRVLDPFGRPIPGLFVAGELGSIFGNLYLSGGNLAECFVGGLTAGRAAAGQLLD